MRLQRKIPISRRLYFLMLWAISLAFPETLLLGQESAPITALVPSSILPTEVHNVAGGAGRPPLRGLFYDVLRDQKEIVTSPARVKKKDLAWVVPLAAGTGFLIATDYRNVTERLHTNPKAESRASNISNFGVGALLLIPPAIYWLGWRHGDSYDMNSGVLAVRAVTDSLIVAEGIQFIARRDRPNQGDGTGRFFTTGLSSSFPSLHATTAWSAATVLAQRYPNNFLAQVGLYGLATAVSVSRVPARAHFPSDVVVGSALGYLVGRYVARQSGDKRAYWFVENTPKTSLAAPPPVQRVAAKSNATPQPVGPGGLTSVPTDSWVYDALDRLAAFGLIPSQISGIRPWTRNECIRQLHEAETQITLRFERANTSLINEAQGYIAALHHELDGEDSGHGQITLDSIYTRQGGISGPVLNDSYHFGQTWANDFGRPFGQGFNSVEGFRTYAESGHFFSYVNGEYQYAPGGPAYSLPVREQIAALDGKPLQNAEAQDPTNRFRTIEAYAGVRLGNFEMSVGKQSLYWGSTYDAPLFFSDNAEPSKNAKITLINPIRLPGLLRYLGEIRGEIVIGKFGGQSYTWRPWFNAQKISFKLTPDLELGFTRWSQFGGVGYPVNADILIRNLTTTTSQAGKPGNYPGEVKGGFDFRWRIPGLRKWLMIYSDSYADDDPSPLAAPRRAAINPGLALSHVPGIPKWSLRMEAPATEPLKGDQGPGYTYWNFAYRTSNTNYGYLIGNSVGRDARAIEGWSTYSFSPRSKVEVGYRQLSIGSLFLPGGGTQTDASLRSSLLLPHGLVASTLFQYERYNLPLLGRSQRNISGWLDLTWEPKLKLLH